MRFSDYKRACSELKKRHSDTLRLQKKVKKCSTSELQKRLEFGLQDVTQRKYLIEETEKQAVRAALVEERSRFCTFVGFLKPVVVSLSFLIVFSYNKYSTNLLGRRTSNVNRIVSSSRSCCSIREKYN